MCREDCTRPAPTGEGAGVVTPRGLMGRMTRMGRGPGGGPLEAQTEREVYNIERRICELTGHDMPEASIGVETLAEQMATDKAFFDRRRRLEDHQACRAPARRDDGRGLGGFQ